jgi:hypothetical protein
MWSRNPNQIKSISHAHGVANRKPYPAMCCSRCQCSRSATIMSTFNTAAIANGNARKNRFVQTMYVESNEWECPSTARAITNFHRLQTNKQSCSALRNARPPFRSRQLLICRANRRSCYQYHRGGFGISVCYRELLAFSLDRSRTEMSMPAHLTT